MKQLKVYWDNAAEACGSIDCTDLEDGKEISFCVLSGWIESMTDQIEDLDNLTPEEIEDWNDMIYNACVEVYEFDTEDGTCETIWEPSDEDLAAIGWKEYPEE